MCELVRLFIYASTCSVVVVCEYDAPKPNIPKKLALAEARTVFFVDSDFFI